MIAVVFVSIFLIVIHFQRDKQRRYAGLQCLHVTTLEGQTTAVEGG